MIPQMWECPQKECESHMLPNFLLEEQVVRANGSGPKLDLGEAHPSLLNVTLGITSVTEQESLDLSIYGSADGENWSEKPLMSFPQKFYCGVYSLLLDLSENPEIRYLRADWKASRWGRGDQTPFFSLYVFAEPAKVPATAGAA